MAELSELNTRLLAKFKHVPNVTSEDVDGWVVEATYQYGYTPDTVATIPKQETGLLLLLAQAEGCRQIAVAVAHYFKYADGDESVDKTTVSEQYRKMAQEISEEYERRRKQTGKSSFIAPRRIDR